MQTFMRTDLGLFGERRLALEPALMAVVLAGGFGAFVHYDLSGTNRIFDGLAWSSDTIPALRAPVPKVAFAPPVHLAFSAGTTALPARNVRIKQAGGLTEGENPAVTTAVVLELPEAPSSSLAPRLSMADTSQDYVIRLTFPEPTEGVIQAAAAPLDDVNPAQQAQAMHLTFPEPLAPEFAPELAVTLDPLPQIAPLAAVLPPAMPPPALTQVQFAPIGLESLDSAPAVGIQSAFQAEPMPTVSTMDLAKLDIASFASKAPSAAKASAGPSDTDRFARANLSAKAGSSNSVAPKLAAIRDRVVGAYIFHQSAVQLNDNPAGHVDVRIGGDASLAIRVSALLAIVEGHMDPALYTAMSASAGAGEYVSFGEIRDAGIDVRYDAGADRIVLAAN